MDQAGQQAGRIVLGVSGGIAAYKSAILVRRLKDAGFDVRVVMTQGALAFITPLTFQALSGNPVHTTLLDPAAEAGMGHIELARWADLILIAPASANTVARLAAGLSDDLLTTVVLASKAPVWLAPAMNQQMWANALTQRNLQTLTDYGMQVIQPDAGEQACGDVGLGRMPEPEALALQVANYFQQLAQPAHYQPKILAGQHVVITAGPTREAIDPVRYVSNHSTGKMGFALAEACRDAGARVTLIAGPVTLPTPQGIERIDIGSAQELLAVCLKVVNQGCDIFIATAAVADYRAAEVSPQKIKKAGEQLTIQLVKNPDIVATVAQQEKRPFMVGFAAETQHMEQYASSKLVSKKLDMIAVNDVSRSDIGFGSDHNAMTVFFAENYHLVQQHLDKASKAQIAWQLVECIAKAQAAR
ncbi:bifunctional phosphopantothenoylcysteine decarboxylase/phosphopantothenate--cysteine ligase CoaBC [Alkanindiges illinoisensis]|uniref:Coenzyme A biosynthesis bifunctional protein CoaBC n=1 Tax=Alkanindiges illinoisensis TaxID=197183 RepID=A0A4Y7XA30_9GAMM|nr:bifunctional phosphopantothenoylcysteine decarboxylase/phosphopantothenate--cysteine ligase CoaBC [Alkanindiges illinoisensis]TEU24815.1 bifunctional phosphopantothenoylcysteine decarboxylase/phosphopantothenate--cysteine ligase CoaBC [Alkanindiges illinoisensis]